MIKLLVCVYVSMYVYTWVYGCISIHYHVCTYPHWFELTARASAKLSTFLSSPSTTNFSNISLIQEGHFSCVRLETMLNVGKMCGKGRLLLLWEGNWDNNLSVSIWKHSFPVIGVSPPGQPRNLLPETSIPAIFLGARLAQNFLYPIFPVHGTAQLLRKSVQSCWLSQFRSHPLPALPTPSPIPFWLGE